LNSSLTNQAASKPRLVVKNLRAGYGRRVILEDVSLSVPSGEIRIVLGGSGCGKSTLLKNAIAIEKPMGGEVEILGEKLDWSSGRPNMEIFRKVGVLFQGGALISSMTVAENVALPIQLANPKLQKSVIADLVKMKLDQVRMGQAYHLQPNELSGGMRKRVALARSIAMDPELLFCDEPSAGLDPVTSRGLDDLLLELRESLGLSLVIVTHELDSIRTLCDKMTFLSGGKVIFDGGLEEAQSSGPDEVRSFLERKGPKENSEKAKSAFVWEN